MSDYTKDLKAVIFDLDGVIFDSRPANIAFYNHLLEYVGLPANAEQSIEIIHRESMEGSLEHLMGKGEHYDKAMDYWQTMPADKFIHYLALFPGVRRTLAWLKNHFRLGVATNRSKTTRASLEHFGLWESFEVVITPLDTGVSKPDPVFMDMATQRLGLSKSEMVYIGDSVVDEKLCQAAGVRLVAFQNRELEAWVHVDDYDSLGRLFGMGA